MFAMINICHDKSFVATKMILVAIPASDIKQFFFINESIPSYNNTVFLEGASNK